MFDPHRTRRNDRRYYTRKGQVLQAKRTEVPFSIEPNKVDAYKEYIIKNNLFSFPPVPPSPSTIISIDAISSTGIQPFPTNQLGYSGVEGGVIQMGQYNPPRVLITIHEQANDYLIIIFMAGNVTSMPVDPLTYFLVLGLDGQMGDYDIKFLSDGQTVFSVQDQVGDIDNTTFLLSKSKYSISLPA